VAGATRDQRSTARDGSDRIARIARWLNIPVKSKAVTELVLVHEDGDTIGRWPIEEVRGAEDSLAYRIDAILVDAANDTKNTITARLSWMAGDVAWQSKTFRATPEAGEQESIRPLDGSMLASLQAGQRHTEALACQLATITQRSEERVERMLGIYERMLESVLVRLGDSEERRAAAEEREHATLELAEQAAAQAEEAQARVEAAAAAKDDPFGKVIEIAARQISAGTAGGKP
jgi:hypothetical protein